MSARLAVLAAVLAVAAAGLAACGDDDEGDGGGEAAGTTTEAATTTDDEAGGGGNGGVGGGETVRISETEFALDPADPTVPAGPVTIEVANDGGTLHNLEVEGMGVEEITDDLDPGQSDTLEIELEPGTYTLYCAIGDHRAQGMEGTLTVE